MPTTSAERGQLSRLAPAFWKRVRPVESDRVLPGGRPAIRPAALRRVVDEVATHEDLWADQVRLDLRDRYYTRLHYEPSLEIWLICWDIAQDTLLHDHGGSSGAFAVARGSLVEDHGDLSGRRMDVRAHPTGSSAAFGPSYVHNLVNVSLQPAVSIHAYAAPLTSMNFYCWLGRRLHLLRRAACASPEPDTTELERMAADLQVRAA